ncbi:electron transport complex subunit RsxC [Halomonas halocynthiae]|uniref:electron transport complex subunit RsxC n=1 Tax=Halomonas halocynthiae TaxID=176290 RepID=UPI000417E51A|nr:electron transport complex subunit RsxC [Halomonas halocynthiae]
MADYFPIPGGITPPSRKAQSANVPLRSAPLPTHVVMPLDQHTGTPAMPCVSVGQRVRSGECIATASGLLSADLHASLSGQIIATDAAVPGSPQSQAIVIKSDGLDEWLHLPSLNWRDTNTETLLKRLAQSGVVGLGGAAFPSHIKAHSRQRHTINTLIVNAAECEPYISCDDATLRAFASDVLEGAQLMAHLVGADSILIGIEDDKPEALAALHASLDDSTAQGGRIDIRVIPTRYPSGGERQLIQRLLGREVPSGGLPADLGVLCHNPGTLRAALHAVRDGIPLVSRTVTLTGEALTHPSNVIARIGTPLTALLDFAKIDIQRLHRLIRGGPLMGQALTDMNAPLTKATNCIIAATQQELPDPAPEMPCIRCAACEEVCPSGLLPQQLYWFTKGQEHDKAERWQLFDCIECGACDYICPSHIPLVDYYRASKGIIRQRRLEAAKADHARHRFELRQARLARDDAEKHARRAARRQAASQRTTNASRAAGLPPAVQPGTPPTTDHRLIASSTTAPEHSAQQAPPAPDLRSLRIAQSAARAAQRKAERTLTRAIESGEDASILADLETRLVIAKENLLTADAQLMAARDSSTDQASDSTAGRETNSQ